MDINIPFILLLLLNGMISMAFFVLAVVYFFIEAKGTTLSINKRTILLSAFVSIIGIIIVIMTRYFIKFPEVGNYDLNSGFNFFIGLISIMFGFFVYIFYIRCGEHFANERALPGSLYLKGQTGQQPVDWKLILIPVPILIAWTFIWFGMFTPDPTELLEATTPEKEDIVTFIYMLLSVSILAPIKEEILYRHFAMGLLYKWLGRGKAAVLFNIIITASLFSVAHVAILTDDWMKIIQILPAGLAFGWINHKRGLEHSIIAHALFNTLVIPISMIADYFM